MLRTRLKRLEKQIEIVKATKDTWPKRIVLRVTGCCHPQPKTYSLAENGLVAIAGCRGGNCRQCPHYEFRP